MADQHEDRLRIRLVDLHEDVDAAAFAAIVQNTLIVLDELNKAVSEHGQKNLAWRVVDAEKNSPLQISLKPFPELPKDVDYGPQVIDSFISGMAQLNQEELHNVPRYFTPHALRHASKLTEAYSRGIAAIEYRANGSMAAATKKVANNANRLMQEMELADIAGGRFYEEYGSIQGTLTTLSLSHGERVHIADELTEHKVLCFYESDEIDKKVREAWKYRVVAFGQMRIKRRTGEPVSLRIDDLRILRKQAELPQIDDLPPIDITEGQESSDYVRGLRDADADLLG